MTVFYKVAKLNFVHSFDHNMSFTYQIKVIQVVLQTRLEELTNGRSRGYVDVEPVVQVSESS